MKPTYPPQHAAACEVADRIDQRDLAESEAANKRAGRRRRDRTLTELLENLYGCMHRRRELLRRWMEAGPKLLWSRDRLEKSQLAIEAALHALEAARRGDGLPGFAGDGLPDARAYLAESVAERLALLESLIVSITRAEHLSAPTAYALTALEAARVDARAAMIDERAQTPLYDWLVEARAKARTDWERAWKAVEDRVVNTDDEDILLEKRKNVLHLLAYIQKLSALLLGFLVATTRKVARAAGADPQAAAVIAAGIIGGAAGAALYLHDSATHQQVARADSHGVGAVRNASSRGTRKATP